MEFNLVQFILSFVVVTLAMFAAFAAWIAMRRGLTHYAFAATVWALALIAAAYFLRIMSGLLGTACGNVCELMGLAEYVLLLLAYGLFILLTVKSAQLRRPRREKSPAPAPPPAEK